MTPTAGLWDHVLFRARVHPSALAVYGVIGPVTYQALVRDVEALATELLERGLTRDDMVGLHFGFSYLHLLLILALDRLSVPSMSLTIVDAGALPEVLPRFGLTAIISAMPAPADPPCRWVAMPEQHRPKLGEPDPARLARIDSPADALVRVLWSSGTTGDAKGSPLTRAVQLRRLALRRLLRNLGPGTRYFTAMQFASAPTYVVALATLAGGGTVILPNPAADFVGLANALGVTTTSAPPSMLAELLGREGDPLRRLETMTCFEVLGTHLPSSLAQQARSLLTPNLWTLYGTSETQSAATAEATVCIADPSAVGYLLPWAETEIVDLADRALPAGDEGIVRIRGEQMIAGYYNDEAATRRNFRDGWFYPGDVGMITAQGLLRVTGRVEDVIVRDGATLSPLPLEEALLGLPGVRDAAVFGLTRPDGGQDVCAALVLDAGADPGSVRVGAASRLGQQAPARLFIIDRLPRNENGKVLRRDLVALAERSVRY